MLKLKQTNIDESISIKDMRVGQIGIITKWGDVFGFVGTLVVRIQLGLIDLNENKYNFWKNEVFEHEESEKFRVKILPNGTELVICNNE